MFTDTRYLADITEQVRDSLERGKQNSSGPEETEKLERFERIVTYFEEGILDYKTYKDRSGYHPLLYPYGHHYENLQQVENKKEYMLGLITEFRILLSNIFVRDFFIPSEKEEYQQFYIDRFTEKKGILFVNLAYLEFDSNFDFVSTVIMKYLLKGLHRNGRQGSIIVNHSKICLSAENKDILDLLEDNQFKIILN